MLGRGRSRQLQPERHLQDDRQLDRIGGALNGTWTVKLKNGAYHVADNGHPIVHGKYTIKGNKISLKDTGGTGRCPGTGVYEFKVSGKSVTMTKVHDAAACIGRKTVLTSGPLTKVS